MQTDTCTYRPVLYIYIYRYTFYDFSFVLFRCIRGKGGFNNNPDTQQFRASLRKLLMKNDVRCSTNANCLAMDGSKCTSILNVKCSCRSAPLVESTADDDELQDEDALLFHQMQTTSLSQLQEAILGYVAGYVVRKLRTKLECLDCIAALYTNELDPADFPHLGLICSKQRGGLLVPSQTVIKLIELCEKAFRQIVTGGNNLRITNEKHLLQKLLRITSQTDIDFHVLDHHDLETAKEDFNLHSTQLKKAVCTSYLRMRLLTHGQKYYTDVVQRKNVGKRQKLTKSIIFSSL